MSSLVSKCTPYSGLAKDFTSVDTVLATRLDPIVRIISAQDDASDDAASDGSDSPDTEGVLTQLGIHSCTGLPSVETRCDSSGCCLICQYLPDTELLFVW